MVVVAAMSFVIYMTKLILDHRLRRLLAKEMLAGASPADRAVVADSLTGVYGVLNKAPEQRAPQITPGQVLPIDPQQAGPPVA
ncbi:hypothetical protein [Actinocorallia libanotica]|uniref:hypothetical protein n=1 Tax=Actinocorallia libanotica TaxID=46162 RepID=UPI0031DDACFB